MLYRNTDIHARWWPHLTDQATGATLELAPGDEAQVDVPDGFTDPYLKAVPEPKTRKPAVPEPPAEPQPEE